MQDAQPDHEAVQNETVELTTAHNLPRHHMLTQNQTVALTKACCLPQQPMSTRNDLYTHEPLADNASQIRVLELHPARSYEDAISCELRIADAPSECTKGARGEYEAISYAWGDPTLTHSIWLEGRRLGITASLDVALRYLRFEDRSRMLWVDAVCINQSDDVEKGQQVRMLWRIFSCARNMLVWLGPGDGDTEAAMLYLRDRGAERGYYKDLVQTLARSNPRASVGFRKIAECTWWSRLWTQMELLFGPQFPPLLVCGRHSARMGNDSEFHSTLMCSKLYRAERIRNELIDDEGNDEYCWFQEMTEYTALCDASDRRDHIFALAATLPRTMRKLGFPDYTLSVSQVYQRTTFEVLYSKSSAEYRIWSQNWIGGSRDLNIPSWCLDFSSRDCMGIPRRHYRSGRFANPHPGSAYNALKSATVEHDRERGLLILEGFEVDRVYLVLPPAPDIRESLARRTEIVGTSSTLKRWLRWLLPFRGKVLHRLQAFVGGEKASKSFSDGLFWDTLVAGRHVDSLMGTRAIFDFEMYGGPPMDHPSLLINSYEDLERLFQAALSSAKNSPSASAVDCVDWLPDVACRALDAIAVSAIDDRLFLTEHGYFGRCPRVEAGDTVALLPGSEYPTVLRPQLDGTWMLIEHAYVHGIMREKMGEGHRHFHWRKFELC